MNNYKCTVAYEGTRYNGWQKQTNTDNTIQEKIETTLSRYLEEEVEVTGSGRTDAGVHAIGQVFNFKCHTPINLALFLSKINEYLPKDIRVLTVEPCEERFHARLNAVQKTYQYRIDQSPFTDLFSRNTMHHIPGELDIAAMKKAAQLLTGTHDFKSFCSNKRLKKSSVRTIYSIDIDQNIENQTLFLTYNGNGFLYNMVRILTGTLIEIGLGVRNAEDIPSILEGTDRGLAGHTAPAKGLFLMEVQYK